MTRAQWFRRCAEYDRSGRVFLWGNQRTGIIRYRAGGKLWTARIG